MIVPALSHVCDLQVDLGPVREMGPGRNGQRRIIPIVGGTVSGKISGTVLDMGADWQTTLGDGSSDIDTRYAMETDDGAVIEIVNKGFGTVRRTCLPRWRAVRTSTPHGITSAPAPGLKPATSAMTG